MTMIFSFFLFQWLLKEFLGFLTEWANEGETIEGLTKKEKGQLCIIRQTIAGSFITGTVGSAQFLMALPSNFST